MEPVGAGVVEPPEGRLVALGQSACQLGVQFVHHVFRGVIYQK